MGKQITCILLFLLLSGASFAQVAISNDGSPPDNAAMLDVKSTSKGLLPPRLTTSQMNAYTFVSPGLMVYNTTLHSICWFNGNSWDITSNLDGKSCGTVAYGGKTYNSVIIGTQCWMTENLNIGTLVIRSQDQTNNAMIEKYCYDDYSGNCDVYGGLYQWAEMVQYQNGATNTTRWIPEPTGVVQGICPAGWHIRVAKEPLTLPLISCISRFDPSSGLQPPCIQLPARRTIRTFSMLKHMDSKEMKIRSAGFPPAAARIKWPLYSENCCCRIVNVKIVVKKTSIHFNNRPKNNNHHE